MTTPTVYIVGGAVRDKLLGNVPKDLDYVVVGADLQWMLDQGFKQVGAAFPVFLHPVTGDEYALARREKKIGPGYKGFEFEFDSDVTLKEDLSRRDLTINAIACINTPQLGDVYIDPYQGMQDLENKIIRHVSDAFAEDPLRVLRVARFAARYQFSIALETVDLCRQLVMSGELDALSADRVWGELEKLFSEKRSSIGLKFLSSIGALQTKRLAGLVQDPPIDYEKIYDHDIEPTLTPVEKMYFEMKILHKLNRDELEIFRVPTHVIRECKFIRSFEILVRSNAKSDPDLSEKIVKTFDTYREEIKSGKLKSIRSLIINALSAKDDHKALHENKKFLIRLDWSFEQLLKLDFTDLVKGIKPSEIKDFVKNKKIEVVNKALEILIPDPCPFCGSDSVTIGYDGQPAQNLYVMCTSCRAAGPETTDGRSSAGSWNNEVGISSAVLKWNERK